MKFTPHHFPKEESITPKNPTKNGEGFTHLHVHSHYSLLDGLPKIDGLLDYVKELGMDSVAITDHGVLYGAVEFYKKAKAKGIKPIIGCEVYTAFERMDQRRPNIDDKKYHLVLLVKNEEGYKNLVQLITKAHLEGFYYKPRIDDELLAKYSKGLIALSGCLAGKIPRLIQSKKFEEAEKLALKYQEIFGKDSFYLELQYHPNIPEQKSTNNGLIAISKKHGIPLVATNDTHYLKKEDAEAQDVLMLINTGANSNDPERLTIKSDDFSLRAPEEMLAAFKDVPEAIENTRKISRLCNFEFELGKIKLPSFPVPNGKTADEYIEELCQQGLKNRFGSSPEKEIVKRLNYELSVIKQAGFSSYFLIVQDLVNWAKKQRIVVGPGRGSVGGSLVAYLLNITNIDPIKNNLLFERFLNPERVSMPDIDLDFTDRRRNEVLEYVAQKYGRDKVAQIITFGTMASRAVIRDVGRALGYTYSYCDQAAKMILFGFTLEETLKKVAEFKNFYQTDEQAKRLIDLAKKLEGVARHASTHACGVVISDTPLSYSIPIQHPTQDDENIVTQYEMHSIEDLGLLKMDFLGLKNLTIIEDALARIYVLRNGLKIDIENLPLDDKETFNLLQRGETKGIFQMEGEVITKYLKQLKPTEFEDLVAMNALNRPGPMQFIPDYIVRKHKKQKIEYLHPKLKPILEKTQGICITGDSCIQTANPGGILQIDKIVNSSKQLGVQSFAKKRFEKKNIIHRFDNGIKDVYKIILRTGKQIKATADHQFLTPEGWKKLRELKEDDFLATPKKLFSGKRKFNKDKLKTLAYLIADGALSNGVKCYFVNKNLVLLKDFKKSAESSFENLKITYTKHIRDVQRANPSKLDSSGALYHQPNTLLKWLRELGLKSSHGGKKSNKKFIPPFIFELNKESISIFLAAYWDCDGGIAPKMVYLTTISEKLSFDIQTLLLKLGINSYIYQTEKYISRYNEQMKVYKIVVYDLNDFYKKVGCLMITNKRKLLIKYLNKVKHDDCKEFVPRKKFFIKVADYLKTNHATQRTVCKYLKMGRKGFFSHKDREKIRLNLTAAKKIANFLKDKELKKICDVKNIRWEDIISINYIGKEHVYDLEIEGTHNFIANNIISHNCIYQEQLMQIAQQLAGFTLAEADILRKAIGKKIKDLLHSQEEKFLQGCIKNGIEKKIAQKIWQWILPFASYGFNRSHSCAYAMIAYQTAFLKAHYPVEFMASVLTSERADIERIAILIEECKRIGIEVLPPNINESLKNFTVVPGEKKIRFGLLAIKNVGENIVEVIVEEKKKNGPFKNIEDFIQRIESKDLNKKSLESLIRAGTFDEFSERNQLLHNLEGLLDWSRETKKDKVNGQKGLFDEVTGVNFNNGLRLEAAVPATNFEKLTWEKQLLGLYVSSHPLEDYKEVLKKKALSLAELKNGFSAWHDRIRVGGIISGIKKIITRKGQPMLFVKLEDLTDKTEVVVFPGVIERNPTVFQEDKIVFISGRVDNRDNVPKIIAEDVEEITIKED